MSRRSHVCPDCGSDTIPTLSGEFVQCDMCDWNNEPKGPVERVKTTVALYKDEGLYMVNVWQRMSGGPDRRYDLGPFETADEACRETWAEHGEELAGIYAPAWNRDLGIGRAEALVVDKEDAIR